MSAVKRRRGATGARDQRGGNPGRGPGQDQDAELKHMEGVIEWLQAKADGPQSYSFSGLTGQHLEKWDISRTQILQLKLDAISRALWSADTLYRHLHMLEGLVPQKNEAAARLWINAFFTANSSTVLSVEQTVQSISLADRIPHTLSGYIDWAVITTTKKNAGAGLFGQSLLAKLKKEDSAFNHVPQALAEMYGCARTVGKPTIRGVLTNGHSWIFLILTLKDGGGANYVQSPLLSIYASPVQKLSKENISLVSAILSYWTLNSHKELNADDDYFVYDSSYPG
ncbi:hypothetical protein CPB84DRAFT_1812999 [Gymnopilus junonius]|uniref:Uncharacterized protein n=1 Tax=Gymnopilus junonius TaxID=109634 RepID=A0A9P5NWI7_GYMJU|nr:hypothetical protein CPB84DRAFT_1812999 [Gymnopilus junonius]